MEKQKPTRLVPVLLAFALLVIDGSASSVSAQTDTTLVSNLGEAVSTLIVAVHSGQKVGVNFRTGPADAAWILSGIKLETPTWPDGTTPMVHLHQVKNGAPGSKLATLTNPTRGTGTRTYPAPSGVLLKPKKTYSFVVESPDTDHPQYIGFGVTASDDEDEKAEGWSIKDALIHNPGDQWYVTSDGHTLRISVSGIAGIEAETVSRVPLRHNGSDFKVRVRFGKSPKNTREKVEGAFSATGGTITHVGRTTKKGNAPQGTEDWFVTISPDGTEAVTLSLATGGLCDESDQVCSKSDEPVTSWTDATISHFDPGVTARVISAPEFHDGSRKFKARVRFDAMLSNSSGRVTDAFRSITTGGTVTKARRKSNGSTPAGQQDWEITVQPDGNGHAVVKLPTGGTCDSHRQVCAKDGRWVTDWTDHAVPVLTDGLVATVVDPPASHDGSNGFKVRVRFSKVLRNSAAKVTKAFSAANGTVVKARRARDSNAPSGQQDWDVTIRPDGNDDATLNIKTGGPCNSSSQPCSKNGEWITDASDFPLTIAGPSGGKLVAGSAAASTVSQLDPSYPNPFNSTTQIAYRLAAPGPVRLVIYNTLGQPVRTLADRVQAAGFHEVHWDARNQAGTVVSAGVYVMRLHHPGGVQSRRLLFLK